MQLLRLKLWANMALVVATTYIVIWYIFTPSNNRCQMTFMMEPPKFIPVPINNADNELNYPQATILDSSRRKTHRSDSDNKYKLYMYSEYGFPMDSNVRSDLRDSMPVLFVPGNAGSYQQVRSLASTCIRRQLESLDAFKFIFYTIDFGGQLSGISGQLIEEQTKFVHMSLKQIAKLHPTETNGVILIGHSVGGFISKVLFSSPNFDPKSVPLLISLASPLTRPYLVFDDKMRELYENTNKFWEINRSRYNNTIAISISGGKPDRLVPMHLSMDRQFDLSLTTTSIRDVWLPTDHVCITWCRELMQKLAHLLSALMDKKRTRLITNKEVAMPIIRDELLINEKIEENKNVILKDWKSMRHREWINLQEFYSATRSQLIDSIIILNSTSNNYRDLLIFIDHIGSLKANGIFGCRTVVSDKTNDQISCIERIDLMSLAFPVPSRRFEPKKTILKLNVSDYRFNRVNYIVLDFVNNVQGFSDKNKVPESLIIQRHKTLEEKFLYIPSLFEYAVKRLLFINSYSDKLASRSNLPLVYLKLKLLNFKQRTQVYSIKYKSNNCQPNERPNGATILFSQGGYLSESFHSTPNSYDKKSLVLTVEIANSEQPVTNGQYHGDQTYLEFYIDGTCDNYIKIELDLLELLVNSVQRNLGDILTCSTFLAYVSVIKNAFDLKALHQNAVGSSPLGFTLFLMQVFGTTMLLFLHDDQVLAERNTRFYWDYLREDSIILIFVLSQGGIASIDYFVRRAVDLAIIVNNAQSIIKLKVFGLTVSEKVEFAANRSTTEINRPTSADFDWLFIGIAIAGSIMLSPALISLYTLLTFIKFGLSIDIMRNEQTNQSNGCSTTNKHCTKEYMKDNLGYSTLQELNASVAVIVVLALLANIPSALISINSGYRTELSFKIFDSVYRDTSVFAPAIALILIKLLYERVGREYIPRGPGATVHSNGKVEHGNSKFKHLFKQSIMSLISNNAHMVTMVPIVFIERNMCNIHLVLLSVVLWLNYYLGCVEQKPLLTKTVDKLRRA